MNTEVCLRAPDTGVAAESLGLMSYVGLIIASILVIAVFALKKKYNLRLIPFTGMFMLVFAFASQAASVPLYAASACLEAQPDVSVGAPGEVQVHNVLQNDTPTPGSSFVLSSLRLALVESPVPGSTISQNKRQVNAPTEGVYVANETSSNGTISFTPATSFSGLAKGVKYTIRDTAGNTTGNTYTPRVTEATNVGACAEGEATLPARHAWVNYYNFQLQDGDGGYGSIIESTADQSWGGVDISSDGQRIVIQSYGNVVVSQDGGESWTVHDDFTEGIVDVSLSDDGLRMAAAANGGYIYTSTDGGVTWIERTSAGSRDWQQIASSANGMHLVASEWEGSIYTSTDGGATWTEQTDLDSSTEWYGVTISDNGQHIAVGAIYGYIYTSADGGATWTEQTSAGSRIWSQMDSSSDGQSLVVSAYNIGPGTSYIYTSADGGATWTERTSAGDRSWSNVSISSNGQRMVATDYDGYIYTSADGGATWTERTGAGTGEWRDIDGSGDGMSIVVVHDYRYIYTSADGGATWTERTLDLPYDANDVDVQLGSAGVQRIIDRTSSEGWRGTYNPSNDELYIEVTDSDRLIDVLDNGSNVYVSEFAYTIAGTGGCGTVTVEFVPDSGVQ